MTVPASLWVILHAVQVVRLPQSLMLDAPDTDPSHTSHPNSNKLKLYGTENFNRYVHLLVFNPRPHPDPRPCPCPCPWLIDALIPSLPLLSL